MSECQCVDVCEGVEVIWYDSECVHLCVSVLTEFYHVCLGMHVCIYICVCEGAGVFVLFIVFMSVCWHLYCVCVFRGRCVCL